MGELKVDLHQVQVQVHDQNQKIRTGEKRKRTI